MSSPLLPDWLRDSLQGYLSTNGFPDRCTLIERHVTGKDPLGGPVGTFVDGATNVPCRFKLEQRSEIPDSGQMDLSKATVYFPLTQDVARLGRVRLTKKWGLAPGILPIEFNVNGTPSPNTLEQVVELTGVTNPSVSE